MTLERQLALLLRYGTWMATALIGLGMALATPRIVTAGIVLFIALPVTRVILMLVGFIRQGDYRLAMTAGMVLAVIGTGLIAGIAAG